AIENHPRLADTVADLEPPEARYHAEATSLDMNALIDVCLVLLIFFILTTTYAAAVQKVVPMPTLKQAEGKNKARVISREDVKRMIRVQTELDRAGKPAMRIENQTASVFDDDGGLDANKLREALQPYTKGEDGKSEIILDAKGVNWGMVIAIQDTARSVG